MASVRWIAVIAAVAVTGGVVAAFAIGGGVSSPSGTRLVAIVPVVRTTLISTLRVGGSIGYAGSYTITAPSPGSSARATADQQTIATDQQAVTTDQQTVSEDEQALSADEQAASDTAATGNQTITADQADVSSGRSALSADQAQQYQECAVTSSAGTGPDTTACTTGEQQVRTDQDMLTTAQQKLAADQQAARTAGDRAQAKVGSDQVKLQGDQARLQGDQGKLGDDQAALASLAPTAANPGTTYTWLPQPGEAIRQDQAAYSVDGERVPLLYGAIPAYRAFYLGMSDGGDVGELTHDLIALGYGTGLPQSDHYSALTAAAVLRWQQARGLPATGAILLGEVVFEPGPIRVVSVTPASGSAVIGGTVLTATGVTPVIAVNLGVDQAYLVKPGDAVSVVLPDGSTAVSGQVQSVGTVATCPGGAVDGSGPADQSPCSPAGGNGTGGTSSIPEVTVTITLDRTPPQARLDQAPVNVSIIERRVANVLAVPVDALLALAGGGHAVQVVTDGTSHLVAVRTGLYSDTLVQVSGSGITAGTQVEVPSS